MGHKTPFLSAKNAKKSFLPSFEFFAFFAYFADKNAPSGFSEERR